MTEKEFMQTVEKLGIIDHYTDKPINSPYFFAIRTGWFKLVTDLMTDLVALGWDRKVAQVKEKFGGLRFYIYESNKEIEDRILGAEEDSLKTCEDCGEPGKSRTKKYWIQTLCEKCVE